MDLLTPAFHVVALVVLVGGGAKVVAPSGFAGLLGTFRVPAPRVVAVAVGVVELALGASALVVGGTWLALALGAAYVLFALTVLVARRRGAPDCGCFGAVAAPPSSLHVVINLVAAAVALGAAAAAGSPPVLEVLADQPLAGIPYLVLLAVATWLVVVLDTTGAVLVDGVSSVARLGPTFRANAATAGVGHRHGGHSRRKEST